MIRRWIGALVCLSLPGMCPAQGQDEAQFRQVALLILQQRLAQPEADYLESTVAQIARETLLPNAEVRSRLVRLLDSLEVQRKEPTAVWGKVIAVGGEEVAPKAVEKFLAQLAAETRKLLAQQGRSSADYDFQRLIKEAARKAKLAPEQGSQLLLKALGIGSGSTMPRLAGIPDRIGILVEVSNPFAAEGTSTPGAASDSGGGAIKRQSAELLRTLMPILLRELPTSDRIKWAAETPDSTAPPDYLLSVIIEDLQDQRAGGQMKRLLKAELTLRSADGQLQVYRRPLKVDQYTSVEKGDTPSQWEAFCRDIAQKVRGCLDEFLSAR